MCTTSYPELVDNFPVLSEGEETQPCPELLINPACGGVAPVLLEQRNAIGSKPEDMLRTDVYSNAHSPGTGAHSQQASTYSSNMQSSSDLPDKIRYTSPQLVSDAHSARLSPMALVHQNSIIQ